MEPLEFFSEGICRQFSQKSLQKFLNRSIRQLLKKFIENFLKESLAKFLLVFQKEFLHKLIKITSDKFLEELWISVAGKISKENRGKFSKRVPEKIFEKKWRNFEEGSFNIFNGIRIEIYGGYFTGSWEGNVGGIFKAMRAKFHKEYKKNFTNPWKNLLKKPLKVF